jgi:molybdopterin/thiamine biosynthesis adenylyltransferase
MSKNIVIVGVGALGSHVLQFCRNLDAQFTVVDFDRIEQKNTLSQFHTAMGAGKNKAAALRQAMQGLFKKNIYACMNKVTADNIKQILSGRVDLVVDCVDNLETRQLLQQFCAKNNVDLLHGALAANGEFAACIWTEHFKPDAKPSEDTPTCEDGEQLPFITLVSSVISQTVQRYVKDGQKNSYHIHPQAITRVS